MEGEEEGGRVRNTREGGRGSQPANLVCTCKKSWQSPFHIFPLPSFPLHI